jgi:hypothetical protein
MAPNGEKPVVAPAPRDSIAEIVWEWRRPYILDIPTKRGFIWGAIVIGGCLVASGIVYAIYNKGWEAYFVKLADTLIQGAVVGIGFAILKGIIEAIKIRPN